MLRFLPIALLHIMVGGLLAFVVRLSVCNVVHFSSQGRYTGPNLYQRVPPSRQVSIYPFRHFSFTMYSLATKSTGKNRILHCIFLNCCSLPYGE